MSGCRPWMPLYVRDFMADTSALSAEQTGAYMLLLMYSWITGPLPVDDAALARICRTTPAVWKRSIKAIVMTFFDVEGRTMTQKRLEKERRDADENSNKKSAASKAMWLKRKETTDPGASASNIEPIAPSPSPSESKKEPPLQAPLFGASASPPPKKKPDDQGTRLPADWQPDAELVAYARNLGLDPERTSEDFRDYWHAKPGKDGRKADWPATWKGWCRREADRRGTASQAKAGFHNGKPITAWNRPRPEPIRNGF